MTKKQSAFIEYIKEGSTLEEACELFKITKRTFYNWKSKHKDFEESFNDSITDMGITGLETKKNKDKKQLFIDCYSKHINITKACNDVGISRGSFYNWLKSDEWFKEECGNANESLIDFAEGTLFEILMEKGANGLPTKKALDSAKFVLGQKGVNRGWGEKIQAEIVLTPYERAYETKMRAKEIVIDYSPEEVRAMAQKEIDEFKSLSKEEQREYNRKEEEKRWNSLTKEEQEEDIKFKKMSGEQMRQYVLDKRRE